MKASKIFISLLNTKIKILPFLILVAFVLYFDQKNEKQLYQKIQDEKELTTKQALILKKELELEYRAKELELQITEQRVDDKLIDLKHENGLLVGKQEMIKKYQSVMSADKELQRLIREIAESPEDLYGNAYKVTMFMAIAKTYGLENKYNNFIDTAYRGITIPHSRNEQLNHYHFNTVTYKD